MITADNVKYFDRVLEQFVNPEIRHLEIHKLTELCDGDEDLGRVIAYEFNKRAFATIPGIRAGLIIIRANNGLAATFYKNGGFTAEFQLRNPTKTPAELLNDHLYMIVKEEGYIPIEEDPIEWNRMDRKLISYGLVEKRKDWIMPTNEGQIIFDEGITVQDYIKRKNAPQAPTINVAGHYVAGSNYNSPLTTNNIQSSSNVVVGKDILVAHKEGKTSILEKLSWIGGIIGGAYIIWEFLIKN